MGLRFYKKEHLRKRSLFRKVFEFGRYAATPMLSVHFLPNLEKSRRVGFSAGKKLGGAVVRNRCKRRLRECYRLHQSEVPDGMDMIIVARRAMVDAKWSGIVASFQEAVRRSRIMIEKNRSSK